MNQVLKKNHSIVNFLQITNNLNALLADSKAASQTNK